jgi:hypothetical protein
LIIRKGLSYDPDVNQVLFQLVNISVSQAPVIVQYH